ncbi:hypothetical protein J7E99_02785 [Streptomyces sp. ISL-44]|uniref:hypothetical protein n=1 Tax=Streptomyces sp. ISL-44 TaxID=2819184 RepID=UPI001BEB957C|nr:hypothetical protein [Streptomyces sp. ISL-44]MBT2539660.1 hypothetical protein [Streptomyces sp. ISL-44]
MAIELNDEPIQLRRAADQTRARAAGPYSAEAWRPWLEAAAVVHDAVTEHAKATGQNRYEVEKALVTAVKNAEGAPEG